MSFTCVRPGCEAEATREVDGFALCELHAEGQESRPLRFPEPPEAPARPVPPPRIVEEPD